MSISWLDAAGALTALTATTAAAQLPRTDTSELFVMGQAWEPQPFIAKPIRANGKKPG